jgi:hypothetical protein
VTPEELKALVAAAREMGVTSFRSGDVELTLGFATQPVVSAAPPMGETPEQFSDRMRRANAAPAIPSSIAADAVSGALTADELAPKDQEEVDAYEKWVRGSGATDANG